MPDDPQPEPQVIPPTPAENTSATSKIIEGRPGVIEGDIDQRLANLLKDHQEMGARPADDDVTVAENDEQSAEPKKKAPAKRASETVIEKEDREVGNTRRKLQAAKKK